MIISASYKTDIPCFYSEWFQNRLRAGFCKVSNAFNRGQVWTVSLRREDVDGFVFWTKNLGPFVPTLKAVRAAGHAFMIQYTINGYPRALESRVVDAGTSIDHMRLLAGEYGPRVGVWRYDTIVHTSITDRDFHLRNFERLAAKLEGASDEVVVSFAQFYKKTVRNMDEAARAENFTWSDPVAEDKLGLLSEMAAIARSRGFAPTLCSQPGLVVPGVGESRCIDARRLSDIAGREVSAPLKGGRAECGCFHARDIGDYDTCPHGCVYCYAVSSREAALRRYREHDPLADSLCRLMSGADNAQEPAVAAKLGKEKALAQLTLPLKGKR